MRGHFCIHLIALCYMFDFLFGEGGADAMHSAAELIIAPLCTFVAHRPCSWVCHLSITLQNSHKLVCNRDMEKISHTFLTKHDSPLFVPFWSVRNKLQPGYKNTTVKRHRNWMCWARTAASLGVEKARFVTGTGAFKHKSKTAERACFKRSACFT